MAKRKKRGTPITAHDIAALHAYRDELDRRDSNAAVLLAEDIAVKWLHYGWEVAPDTARDAREYRALVDLIRLCRTRRDSLETLRRHIASESFLDAAVEALRALPELDTPRRCLRLVVDNTR